MLNICFKLGLFLTIFRLAIQVILTPLILIHDYDCKIQESGYPQKLNNQIITSSRHAFLTLFHRMLASNNIEVLEEDVFATTPDLGML